MMNVYDGEMLCLSSPEMLIVHLSCYEVAFQSINYPRKKKQKTVVVYMWLFLCSTGGRGGPGMMGMRGPPMGGRGGPGMRGPPPGMMRGQLTKPKLL